MKSVLRIVVVAVVFGLVAQLVASPAGAAIGRWDRPEARIDVQATRWNPGSALTLTASHFEPGETVVVRFGDGALLTEVADTSGGFSVNAVVPADAPGTHLLTATGQQSQRLAEFVYNVQAFNPWGEPSSYWVPVGTPLTFAGHRFANGETVDVLLDGKIVATGVADSEGEFIGAGPYVVPREKFAMDLNFVMQGRTSGAIAAFRTGVANWPLLSEIPEQPEEPVEPDQPDPAGPEGPSLVSTSLVPMYAGESRWQSLEWLGGDFDVCDFQATADAGDASSVTYPSSQDSSYPSRDRSLSGGEADFTAVRIALGDTASNPVNVRVEATYRLCDSASLVTASFLTEIPVRVAGDPALRQVTNDMGVVPANAVTWIQPRFAADGPGVTDVRVTAGPTAGISFGYPQGRDYTTPAVETYIAPANEDYVGIRLDIGDLAPGVHVIPVVATYGSPVETVEFSVSITIA